MKLPSVLERGPRSFCVRVVGGLVIMAILAVSWWELLFLPLGASHDGRINARFGLHIRNLLETGLSGSDFLASMAPFSSLPYVHHPPLMNLLHAAIGSTLGQGEWQLHLIGYLAGLATVAGLLWLARELGLGAGSSVLVMGLVVSTPMFWIYARLGLGVSIMVALLALWRRYQNSEDPGCPRPLGVVAGVAAFSSWMGAVLVLLLAGSGASQPGYRRRVSAVGVIGLLAVAVTLIWATTVGEVSELVEHAATRRRWPEWASLVENYRWFYGTLYPGWFRWLILPTILAALVDCRTRLSAGSVLIALAAWTLVTPGAAYVHDYWTYPLFVPVFLGLTVLLDRLVARLPSRGVVLAGAAGLILVAAAGFADLGPYRDAYFRAPSDAGALIREVGPAPGQTLAWVTEGVDQIPRWVSYYWDLPFIEVTGATIDRVGGDDLVLARIDRRPSWVAPSVQPVAREGRYALFTGGSLQAEG